MVACMAAGENESAGEFRVTQVRLDEGNLHGIRFSVAGGAANLTACLNVTPAPKLNRCAESAVLTSIVNETKMLAARMPDAHETSLKSGEVRP